MHTVQCPVCGRNLTTPGPLRGAKVKCPACGANGVDTVMVEREDHYWCWKCGRTVAKVEPAYRSPYMRFPTEV